MVVILVLSFGWLLVLLGILLCCRFLRLFKKVDKAVIELYPTQHKSIFRLRFQDNRLYIYSGPTWDAFKLLFKALLCGSFEAVLQELK